MSNLLPKPDQIAFQETAPGRQIRPGRSLPWLLAGLHVQRRRVSAAGCRRPWAGR